MTSREPSCLGCIKREKEIRRLRLQNRDDLMWLEEAQSDVRALRRAVQRLQLKIDELEGARES